MASPIESLANTLVLGALLDRCRLQYGGYELCAHWKQGEFHHDLVLRLHRPVPELGGSILVVSTNCNGGIKEILCVREAPDRGALWHHRCPDSPEFRGELGEILAVARTPHWFDPCDVLAADARSELKPEFRRRQRGGGWEPCLGEDC
jgi:hypothetical protein